THTTSEKRSENLEKAINRLYTFFNLIGFSALFLGGIGVAGSIHIHISERLQSVATLRCLGCSSAQAFAVYLAQSIAMGVAGTLAGVGFGCGFVLVLDWVISSLPAGTLPFDVDVAPTWFEVIKAAAVGLIICVSFALLPLLAVRRVSPLAALRREQVSMQRSARDPWRWMVMIGLVAFAFLLTWLDTADSANGWKTSLGYIGFLAFAFVFLTVTGKLLRWFTKLISRPSWPFVIRQGIASLHRPNNQTGLFMVSIGLGVFLIFTLVLMQNILLQWLDPVRMSDKPNLFMVDIPPEEKQSVATLIADSGVKLLGDAPIVQMRLTEIKGRPVTALTGKAADGEKQIPRWILRREFRSTFRKSLTDTEKLVAGEWIGKADNLSESDAIPVSFERKLANDLGLRLGDEVTISIEGFGVTCKLRIASLRDVDWRSMNLNFFIVFPKGVIDDYVSFDVLAAHSPDDDATANLQQAMFKKLPYVNTIDLSLILKTVQSILSTAGKTVQIMALFTVVTGAIVLVASILAGRRIRIRESVLLRTLGATRKQISSILAVEYALLGLMATMAGSILAVTASYLLGRAVFEGDPYHIPWGLLATGITLVVATTIILGMLLSRGIANRPPLEVLRAEGAG
ncbi:MAG: FtsX-like permease family protein, partial [Verrucomicrobiae bacterium]|nr:FtsX-like permease family protein [Verrucomicrobiae bacterium]NNJ87446.1 FtsX-like permease family protein [Akkermansiaceae bacterium]